MSQRIIARNLKEQGKSYEEIGTLLGVNKERARHLIRYCSKACPKKSGPKPKITPKFQLRIKRSISSLRERREKINCPKILKDINLNVSSRTLQRYMKITGFKYRNAKTKIVLSMKQKQERIRLITDWISRGQDWRCTAFSDEKKFNLDGPDNWLSYTNKPNEIYRQTRQCKGGGVLVWLMVMPNDLIAYKIIHNNLKSDGYLQILQEIVVPILKLNFSKNIWYQDDNCAVHRARKIKEFMLTTGIHTLEWPSKSPDINIVEDIWHLISSRVYDGPQFEKKSDLIAKIHDVIFEINTRERHRIHNLFDGINKRLCTVLSKLGNLYNK